MIEYNVCKRPFRAHACRPLFVAWPVRTSQDASRALVLVASRCGERRTRRRLASAPNAQCRLPSPASRQ